MTQAPIPPIPQRLKAAIKVFTGVRLTRADGTDRYTTVVNSHRLYLIPSDGLWSIAITNQPTYRTLGGEAKQTLILSQLRDDDEGNKKTQEAIRTFFVGRR